MRFNILAVMFVIATIAAPIGTFWISGFEFHRSPELAVAIVVTLLIVGLWIGMAGEGTDKRG